MVVHDVMALMEEEDRKAEERAEKARSSFIPTFLRLKDKQKARVRPLSKLSQCVVIAIHNKYLKAEGKYLNAVCSTEVGAECPYCQAAKEEKEYKAVTTFMLPVYVSVIEQAGENNVWTPVTYKKDDEEFEVSGLRILELKRFGTINDVFQVIRDLDKDDEEHDIRRYGLIIERHGSDQKTSYTVLPKGPSAMPEAAKSLIPSADDVRKMVLQASPPAGTVVSSAPASSSAKTEDKDFDF